MDGTIATIAGLVRGGVTMVQVRAKRMAPRDLLDLVKRVVAAVQVPVIVNDRADIALMAGAAGVHLGSEDLPVSAVRSFAPRDFIIGASVGSVDELGTAHGADYVGIGPAFATSSKSDAGEPLSFDAIADLQHRAGVPAIAIGGITPANARALVEACPELAGVAAVTALFAAADGASAAAALRAAIGK